MIKTGVYRHQTATRPTNWIRASSGWAAPISWCVPVMALLVLVIVVLRYGFNTGAIAAQESVQYLHAAIFMLGAAVTLGADQHVRVDIFYRSFTPGNRHGSTHWATSFSHCRFAH